MNTQKYHVAIVVLLLGVVLLPVTTASQSADRDLGIVRLRYVTIVVRNYDEALKWYTNVLGLEKTEDGTFGLDKRWLEVVGCCPAGPKGLWDHLGNCQALLGPRQRNQPESRDRKRSNSQLRSSRWRGDQMGF